MTQPETRPSPPPRIKGLRHLFAAASYSLAGLRRLSSETAFRHELLWGAAGVGLLVYRGTGAGQVLGWLVLILALIAVEALNTAIECIVDRVSPEWSEFARDAKDLGSFAVACLIGACVLYLGWALLA